MLTDGGITVTMGGNDITSSAVNGTQIHINKVLADITINATAMSEIIYNSIDLVDESNNFADPSSSDWKNDSRGSWSKEIDTASGKILTNKIAVQNGDIIFIKGLNLTNSGSYYSLLYTTSHTPFYPETDTTYVSDYGVAGDWKYFTINQSGATGLRICALTPSDLNNVFVCIYRNGEWLEIPEPEQDTPLSNALSTINTLTSSNNFADPSSSDWKTNARGSSSAGIANDGIGSSNNDAILTNKIAVQYGDIVFVKGLSIRYTSNRFSIVYFPTGTQYQHDYPTASTYGAFSDSGTSGDWTYFTINISNATALRVCAMPEYDASEVAICIYRNGEWVGMPEPEPDTPLSAALSTINTLTSSNNFADPSSSDWKNDSRGSGSKEIDAATGKILTNKITVQNGDIVFVKGLSITNSGNFYSLLYTTSHNIFYPESNTTYVSDYGVSGDWKYFTINQSGATGLRVCALTPSDLNNVFVCIYRNGEWVGMPEPEPDTPLSAALSTINTLTSSNNFADPSSSDWKNDSRGSGSKEIDAATGKILTNKITVQNGDIVFVKGLSITNSGNFYSLLYTTSHNIFYPESNTTYVSDYGVSGDWKYFTINQSGATGLRVCALTPSDLNNVFVCIYRPNVGWLS